MNKAIPPSGSTNSLPTNSLLIGLLAPGASIPELALQLGKSESAIERAIRKLRAEGKLVCIGPAKGGHWQVSQ